MSKKNKVLSKEIEVEKKSFIALKTISILAGDKNFQLNKGEEISSEIPAAFIESLKNSNLIK